MTALSAALVLEGVRAMSDSEREQLRVLLELDTTIVVEADRWMDAHGAADYLGISINALHKLSAAREMPFEQDGPGCKLWFCPQDLDRWRRGGRSVASNVLPHARNAP
jgi:hypothetical protein